MSINRILLDLAKTSDLAFRIVESLSDKAQPDAILALASDLGISDLDATDAEQLGTIIKQMAAKITQLEIQLTDANAALDTIYSTTHTLTDAYVAKFRQDFKTSLEQERLPTDQLVLLYDKERLSKYGPQLRTEMCYCLLDYFQQRSVSGPDLWKSIALTNGLI